MGRVQGRGHRAAGDAERLGDARVVEVGVVAEEEREPLALGERGERGRSGARLAVAVGRGPRPAASTGGVARLCGRVERFRASFRTIRQTQPGAESRSRSWLRWRTARTKRVVDGVEGGLLVTR